MVIEGTAFRVTLSDGSVLPQERLPGTVLSLGDGTGKQRRIRIDTVEWDARDPRGEVVLYGLSEADPVDGAWHNACNPDPDGRRLGFPLAGSFSTNGRYDPRVGGILITCTGGAEGKCIRFGYAPWRTTPGGIALAPYYQACVRAVRADYCGDGIGHTRNGTLIDIFDRVGIQEDQTAPGVTFEAAFAPDGAVCVRRTRLPASYDLDRLRQDCPRLAKVASDSCTDSAQALVFIGSLGP